MNKFFLIGMPAAGKTTAGKFISDNTNLELFDLDEEIEKYCGKKISDIFHENGEEYFRKIENNQLTNIIKKYDKFILSLGGGTPCYKNNMDIIKKSGVSFFIDRDLEFIINKVKKNKKRPMFYEKDDIEDFIKKMYSSRKKFYNRSNFTVKNKEEILSLVKSITKSKN